MKKRKLMLASLLAALCISVVPGSAFAAETGNQTAETEQPQTKAETETETETEPETEAKSGWVKEGGKVYYYVDNKPVTGLKEISGSKYYFNSKGERQTGVVKVDTKLYYFSASGKAYTKKGWFKKKTLYANGDGTIASSVKKISKKYYLFDAHTGLKKKKGFAKQYSKRYYVKSNSGEIARGWTQIGKRAYFFEKKGSRIGAQVVDKKVGYLKIPKKGYLGEAYALGIKKLNKTKWTLRQAYRNSYRLTYYDRWWRTSSAEKYSLRGFKQGRGNCYVMACTSYIQAKLLGYNVRVVHGRIGTHPHCWTQIKQGGKWWIYDPNFTNETGRNGWKIWYGKSGTWRYGPHSVFQN